jgi:hypothetical protein
MQKEEERFFKGTAGIIRLFDRKNRGRGVECGFD